MKANEMGKLKGIKIKFNVSEGDKWITVFLVLMIAISLILMSIFTFEEICDFNSANPMWLVHISGGLAFVITLIFIKVLSVLDRQGSDNDGT